ncbi:MAG: sensor histidine kinase [Bacteroidota bacterium]
MKQSIGLTLWVIFCFLPCLFLFSQSYHPSVAETLELLNTEVTIEQCSLRLELAYTYKNSNTQTAAKYADVALMLAERLKHVEWIGSAKLEQGSIARLSGEVGEATKLQLESLQIAEENSLAVLEARSLVGLSATSFVKGEIDNAIQYYLRAFERYYKEEAPIDGKLNALTALANLYMENNQLGEARRYLDWAKEIKTLSFEPKSILYYFSYSGDYFEITNQPDSAIKYYETALLMARENGDFTWEVSSLMDLARVQSDLLENPRVAIDSFLLPAADMLETSKDLNLKVRLYEELTWAYYDIDPKQSLDYYDLFYQADSTLRDKEKDKNIAKYKALYELEKVEKERTQFIQQRNNLFLLCILLLLVIAAAGFAYQKRRLATLLEKKKVQEEKQLVLDQLKTQELESINAMVDIQGKERERIAGELHDRVGSLLATVKLNYVALQGPIRDLGEDTYEKYQKANSMLDQAYNDIRAISHDMNSGVLAQFGLIPATRELQEAIQRSGKLEVNLDTFGMEKRLDNKAEIFLYRIIQEAMANIIKHADAKVVDIQLSRDEDMVNLIIEDDGKGFEVDKINPSSGMGLSNLRMRVEQLDGTFDIDSTLGKGTSLIIDIPAEADN